MSTEAIKDDTLDVAGHRITDTRAGRGPAAVLIHGIPTNHYLWCNIVPPLLAVGLEVITLDLPGYGASDKLAELDLGIKAHSDMVAQTLQALGWPGGTLVGHGMCGGVTQLIAVPSIIRRNHFSRRSRTTSRSRTIFDGSQLFSLDRETQMNRMAKVLTIICVSLNTAACTETSTQASTAPIASSSVTLSSVSTEGCASDVTNPNIPGATGRTIVPGDNSTIAGDALATQMRRTGAYGK
jgi:alpha/beta hydrolase fold